MRAFFLKNSIKSIIEFCIIDSDRFTRPTTTRTVLTGQFFTFSLVILGDQINKRQKFL